MTKPFYLTAAAILLPFACSAIVPSYTADVAPILNDHCVSCHHTGGLGPFPLDSFREVTKHAKLMAEVTQAKYMPPWLPEKGCGDFVGERRLEEAQIATISAWFKAGAPEGDPARRPATPKFSDDWQLGKPDLIVTLPDPYELPADGVDVYRNFVIPVPLTARRFVKAAEFRPGNNRAIHHMLLLINSTGEARKLDEKDPGPGFGGMDTGPETGSPQGFLIGWQPGRIPTPPQDGLSWPLEPKSDLVFQLHMRPTGKPEKIQPTLALYFSDTPPTKFPMLFLLRSCRLDVPAGATNFVAESSYKLPVDSYVLSLLPHAHYLAKDITGWIEHPDGTRENLLHIKDWDFNWQGDYRYREPVFIPKGSTLHSRFTYDNSTNNLRNTSNPPRAASYGLQTSDEMCELWFQVLPARPADYPVLARDYYANYTIADSISLLEQLAIRNPADADALVRLANAYAAAGRMADAYATANRAIELNPTAPGAHRMLAQLFIRRNSTARAIGEFALALRDDPDDAVAHSDLGWLLYCTGDTALALSHLETALRLNPADEQTRTNLETVRIARVRIPK